MIKKNYFKEFKELDLIQLLDKVEKNLYLKLLNKNLIIGDISFNLWK